MTTTGQLRSSADAPDTDTPAAPPVQAQAPRSIALNQGEEPVLELAGVDGASFALTTQRVVYLGAGDGEAIYAAARLADISSVQLVRRPRDRRAVAWAVAGLIAAVGVWQVSTSSVVGAVTGGVVALISLGLLADYWFRPGGLVLHFQTAGGAIGGPVDSRGATMAKPFADRVEALRDRAPAVPAPLTAPARPAGRAAYPPL